MSGGGGFDPNRFDPAKYEAVDFTVDLNLADEVEVDLSKLSSTEVTELESALVAREQRIATLQHRVVTAETNRSELQATVSTLESRNAELVDQLADARKSRVDLEARDLLGNFGKALDDVEADLGSAGYGVADVQVDLKAGVVNTDNGVRFHLPGVSETVRAESLSTIRFGVKPQTAAPELDYQRVPSVVGREVAEATALLRQAGFAVDATADAGVVVDQFPSSRAVAEPGEVVELTVEVPAEEESTDESAEERHSHRGDDGDRVETDDGHGETVDEAAAARPVEDVLDIGPTFGGRLREGGIETVGDVASADVERLATLTGASEERAGHWLDHAAQLLAGDPGGGDKQ
ncbi:PASTA domain-containing protein [Halogranum gelatinilyticum]|uniref:PASTA domain-containing protein n=1 Tax=Halogranum gelatinilyticum TaxID=660521 RepID=A0A1G9T2Y4_9EURY|nr:PASTA domain-containing protein [Halogranum gelatinilyticum]SDM42041.1 PASTA domain-containing protein [Halogranum gelatinilyticum]